MTGASTIQLKSTRKSLQSKDQYDKFMRRIQQRKMKEFWDNKEDDVWENARPVRKSLT